MGNTMNYLSGLQTYLSGPMDYVADNGVGWRDEITPKLINRFGLKVFDPTKDPKQMRSGEARALLAEKRYDEATKIIRDFVRKDLYEVDFSPFIIAKIILGVTMTGTVHEIINATNLHRPTILFCDEGKHKIPAWYYGIVPHRYFFGCEAAVLDYLEEVNDGKHKEDRRWAKVYDLL